MRLWTVHPKYLDSKGLVALWREGLLAKAVLEGKTRGYTNHPQLHRFKEQEDPVLYVAAYLQGVLDEARVRGYNFDAAKIPSCVSSPTRMAESDGQMMYEWEHLMEKLKTRSPELYSQHSDVGSPDAHPLFTIVEGGIQPWEKTG